MSKKGYIKKAIEKFTIDHSFIFRDWSNWYVGITRNIDKRKKEHQSKLGRKFKLFRAWKANSVADAVELEKLFLKKGMRGATGGWGRDSGYIYIYKISGPGS